MNAPRRLTGEVMSAIHCAKTGTLLTEATNHCRLSFSHLYPTGWEPPVVTVVIQMLGRLRCRQHLEWSAMRLNSRVIRV